MTLTAKSYVLHPTVEVLMYKTTIELSPELWYMISKFIKTDPLVRMRYFRKKSYFLHVNEIYDRIPHPCRLAKKEMMMSIIGEAYQSYRATGLAIADFNDTGSFELANILQRTLITYREAAMLENRPDKTIRRVQELKNISHWLGRTKMSIGEEVSPIDIQMAAIPQSETDDRDPNNKYILQARY